jgi:Flp pilus assembly protein TadG
MPHHASRRIRKNRRLRKGSRRRGVITVLVAFLLIPFLGMVAFAIDIAWIVQSRSDLQNAADAAALAGAEQLMSGSVQYSLAGQTQQSSILSTSESSAKTYAKNFAGYNTAGGVSSLTLNDADVQFGFTNASNNYTAAPGYAGFPNTVKVTMRLDSTSNGALKLFFSPIFGVSSRNLTATAAATIYTGSVVNFNSNSGHNAAVLPMTLDVNAWNTFLASGVSSDGTTHSSVNGAPQMEVYPSPSGAPGNFGMLSLDDSSNSASAIAGWISSGLGASDLATIQSDGLLPVSLSHALWNWKGAPGFKASDLNDLSVGQTFLLPLFEPVDASGGSYQATNKDPGAADPGNGGKGSNAYYNIIRFVGITITQVDKSSDAYIQPVAMLDSAMVFDSTTVVPAGTTSQLSTTFTTPKLTQ